MLTERMGVALVSHGPKPVGSPAPAAWRCWYGWAKAPAECCVAFLLLFFTSPLILCAVLAVKLTSKGPAFYSQIRFGRHGRPFAVCKVRSMKHNCEAQSGICWSASGDPRVTAVGRFLRTTHIDELPQLWNVLRGDM